MQTPLELAFQGIQPSEAIKMLVAEKVAHLETFHPGITSCHVHIRAPHHSQRKGNIYEITIEVRVPGGEIVVRRNQGDSDRQQHLQTAIRDAFAAMAGELKRRKEAASGDVKTHETPMHGKVVEIHHDRGFGQILAADHRLVYFHRNSVTDGSFDELQPRDTVELVIQSDESETGPQASMVRRIADIAFEGAAKPSRR